MIRRVINRPALTYHAAATLQYSWYNVVMVTAYGTESNLIRYPVSHQTSAMVRLCYLSPTKNVSSAWFECIMNVCGAPYHSFQTSISLFPNIDSLIIRVAGVALSPRERAGCARYDWLVHGHVTSARGYHVVHRRVSGGLQRSLSNDKKG